MKNITEPILKFIVLFMLAAYLFSACTSDEKEGLPPTLSVTFSDSTELSDTIARAGQPIEIIVNGVGNGENITYYSIIRNGDHVLDSGLNATNFKSIRQLIRSTDSIEEYTILIRDRNFRESSVYFTIGLQPTITWGNIRTFNHIVLGSQNNISIGSFLNLFSGHVYNLSQAFLNQDSVQMLYFYDATDLNTIASPNANIDTTYFGGSNGLVNWTIKNEIRYVQLFISEQEFLSIQNDSLIIANLFPYEVGKRKAKLLAATHVYEFCFNGKYGVFYVNNVVGTHEGTIDLSIKMQE